MVRTTWPSLPIRIKAFGANVSEGEASLRLNGRLRLIARPPPMAALVVRKLRRDRLVSSAREVLRSGTMISLPCVRLRSELDCLANSYIGPAPADIAAHGAVDIAIGRMWVARQKRRSRHDLPGLAIAALDDLMVEPRLLDLRAGRRRADRLDGRDF